MGDIKPIILNIVEVSIHNFSFMVDLVAYLVTAGHKSSFHTANSSVPFKNKAIFS